MSEGASLDKGRALITAFFADGVAIFWCISGFFMYDNFNYKHTLQRTAKTVVIPLMIFSAVIFLFGEQNLGIKDVIRSVIYWENPFSRHVQLWYLYIYILLMLFSPVVYALIRYLKKNEQRENWFMILSFGFLVWNDVSNNQLAAFSHHTWNALVPAMILTVWGNLLYHKLKDATLMMKHAAIGMLVFFGCNGIRLGIQILRSSMGVDGIHIYFWFTSIALVNVIALMVVVFALLNTKRKSKRIGKFICGLSSYTFMIYLVHMLVYRLIQKFINLDKAYEVLCAALPSGEGFLSEIIYVVIIVPIVFVLSLMIGFGLSFLKRKK